MISIKSKREIELLRKAGYVTALAHEAVRQAVKPGISTLELDKIAEDVIRKNGGRPAFKGYDGFPASICASVNEEVVHGIPNNTPLKEGDIVSVDIGVEIAGYYGDCAKTHAVGKVSKAAEDLIRETRASFYEALMVCQVGRRLSDIGHTVQSYAEARGYGVVRDLIGHGVGTELHEDPPVPNYGLPGKGPRLQVGMVIAIEPMITMGDYRIITLDDDWTVVTKDRSLASHHEHTIAILEDGPRILTALE